MSQDDKSLAKAVEKPSWYLAGFSLLPYSQERSHE